MSSKQVRFRGETLQAVKTTVMPSASTTRAIRLSSNVPHVGAKQISKIQERQTLVESR